MSQRQSEVTPSIRGSFADRWSCRTAAPRGGMAALIISRALIESSDQPVLHSSPGSAVAVSERRAKPRQTLTARELLEGRLPVTPAL